MMANFCATVSAEKTTARKTGRPLEVLVRAWLILTRFAEVSSVVSVVLLCRAVPASRGGVYVLNTKLYLLFNPHVQAFPGAGF